MKIDPFTPQLLIDYDLYWRRQVYFPLGDYMARRYFVQALTEAAEAEGEDPPPLTVDNVNALFCDTVY